MDYNARHIPVPVRPLDGVFPIFHAFNHPFVMVGNYALRWMGVPIQCNETIDILVRTSQHPYILGELLQSGNWKMDEENPGGLQRKYITRIKRIGGEFYMNLWREDLYKLSVDSNKLEVPDFIAFNTVLIEKEFHPDIEHRTCGPRLITDEDIRVLPHTSTSSEIRFPIFIPTISDYLESCLYRARYERGGPPGFPSYYGSVPSDDIDRLLKYLSFGGPQQQGKSAPGLATRSQQEAEKYQNLPKEGTERRKYFHSAEAHEKRRQRRIAMVNRPKRY